MDFYPFFGKFASFVAVWSKKKGETMGKNRIFRLRMDFGKVSFTDSELIFELGRSQIARLEEADFDFNEIRIRLV